MATMNLRDFVKSSLTEILGGIVAAQQDTDVGKYISPGRLGTLEFPAHSGLARDSRRFAPTVTAVKFDVAVTVEANLKADPASSWTLES